MLLRQIVFLVVLLCYAPALWGKGHDLPKDIFSAENIPDSLKQDAHAVLRYCLTDVHVTDPGKATITCHSVVTILDEKGDEYATLVEGYNKRFRKVKALQMKIYSANGSLIKKYGMADAYDHSATDGFSIITDERMLILQHNNGIYPFTVEKEYEVSLYSYLDLPDWHIQTEETTIQQEIYKVTVAPGLGFRYRNTHVSLTPQKETVDGKDVYTWQVAGLKALKIEPGAPEWTIQPNVRFATDKFSFDGLPGDFSTWEGYGKWYYALNADVCTLGAAREAELKKMVAGLGSDKEKARYLYSYLQQNMRYVSIQLGIGGLKPFPASFVDEKKYGDCKALANYMCAMLKAVGIKSYTALVRAGTNEPPAYKDFPDDPFNHVILCVPFKDDTTWLECTSNTQQFGKLGTFTENRNALLITENGGILINTPESVAKDNQFNSVVHLKLSPEGAAEAQVDIQSTGSYRSLFVDQLPTISEDKQKAYLIRSLKLRQPNEFEYKSKKDSAAIKETSLSLAYSSFYDINAGDKKFFHPAVLDLWTASLPDGDKRSADFYFDNPLQKSCTTVISLPEGYGLEALPANEQYKFSYGAYEISYSYNNSKNEITSVARLNINNHIIPAASYAEMQQFMGNITRAQSRKIIVKKKA